MTIWRPKTVAVIITVLAALAWHLLLAPPPSLSQEPSWKQKLFKAPSETADLESKLQPLGEDIPDWQARWELARLLSYVKRYNESIAAYRKVLAAKPDLIEAKAELAKVLIAGGRPEDALALFKQIPADRLDDASRIMLGDLYAYQQQYDTAIEIYGQYLQAHPDNHTVRLRLAEVLSWSKQYDAALTEYRQLLKERPDDRQIRRKYALVLAWAKHTDEAIAELKKTLP